MKKNKNKAIIIWLFTGCFLIALMVIIGGITRLTHSGLSMVEWKLIAGSIPPLNDTEWQTAFEKYQEFPEYKIKHSHFTLSDFKSIFWWEFSHRSLGRFIGMVFIIPFLFFLIRKKLKKPLLKKLIILLFLGGFQGFLGWFMVKSGLVNRPDVSHYRLAAHLVTALLAYSYSFWLALELLFPKADFPIEKIVSDTKKKLQKVIYFLMGTVLLQITYGGFVAGLKAGLFFRTFPDMDGQFIPDAMSLGFSSFGMLAIFEDIATVQFLHRYIALTVVLVAIYIWQLKGKLENNRNLKIGINVILFVVLLQFTTGVYTLLYGVPLILGVIHQFGAILVLSAGLFITYFSRSSED